MTVIIEIHFTAASRGYKKGEFQLRGRKPEFLALQFWKQINKELSYRAKLEKVIVDGGQDITEAVLELERQEDLKAFYAADDLHF
ncbi:hypothetical protein J1P26_18155 [Neobacillus sp. MM2021_6]|uniref:hypothetical protein n=1 Tax=Bacillaceae TaxID=186817 RepID=UPI00140DD7A1|nr:MULTISPECIES: hypothetical protein [Bacillaceae]MBO0961632.1 hypothetical protein [Neobacillus sp. MM2021_6]